MKTPLLLLSAALALTALAPAGQAYTGPYRDANPCESGFGAYAVVGDVCVDTRATWCTLWIEWTAIPAPPTCLVAPLAASADVQCMDVYSRHDVGRYSVVRRDSCAPPEVFECPYQGAPTNECDSLLKAEAAASADCYDIYNRWNAGPVSVVQRSSCDYEVYQCPYEGAPLNQCQQLALEASSAAAGPEPQCMDVYREYRVGPVLIVSRDSCHAEAFICGEPAKEVLAADPLATAQCTVDSLGILA